MSLCDGADNLWKIELIVHNKKLNTAQKETTPLKVDRVTLKRYVMWYIALHIVLDNLFLHILTPHLP